MRHVLVIRLSALGDVAILVPVLQGYAGANPDVTFTVAPEANYDFTSLTVNGEAVTADNFQTFLHNASQYSASYHTFNVVFDGSPVQ